MPGPIETDMDMNYSYSTKDIPTVILAGRAGNVSRRTSGHNYCKFTASRHISQHRVGVRFIRDEWNKVDDMNKLDRRVYDNSIPGIFAEQLTDIIAENDSPGS
jgi:hypothetical protein